MLLGDFNIVQNNRPSLLGEDESSHRETKHVTNNWRREIVVKCSSQDTKQ